MPDVSDLVYHAAQQQPVDFESTFKDIMLNRLADAIDAKKVEVAQIMFNNTEVEDTEELEDQEDGKITQ